MLQNKKKTEVYGVFDSHVAFLIPRKGEHLIYILETIEIGRILKFTVKIKKTSHFLESPHTNKLLRYPGRLKCPTRSPKPSPDRIQKELRRENTILKYQ